MIYSDTAIIIPARSGSTRLANKPLATIGNKVLIEHVVTNLQTIFTDNLYVATDTTEIADIVTKCNAKAIMTEDCVSGTDRVYQAFTRLPNAAKYKYVVNVQGDMPFVEAHVVQDVIELLQQNQYDIVTPVVPVDKAQADDPSNVKVVINKANQAMYFSRSPIPYNSEKLLYHVGIYGFTVAALQKFTSLKPTFCEQTENLEQLRALENNMKIGVCFTDAVPISVDTQADLTKAIAHWQQNN